MELDEKTQAFRDDVRSFLAPYAHLHKHLVSDGERELTAFYKAMAARNWLALAWPEEVGGLARPPIEEYVLWNEIAYRRAARIPLSIGVVAKTIIRYGTVEQKAAWLDRIRRYDITFALAYSEPEAGSDLTGLRCTAELRDGHYVVNGNKCWNSRAHHCDYLWLLCRTGPAGSRSAGLSLLIVDTKAPGVKIRPIRLMDGNHFTEIFFDEVVVPADCRVGPENGAWAMMAASLADERHVQFLCGRVRRDHEDVREWVRANGLAGDPLVRRRLDELYLDVLEAEVQSLRVVEAVERGWAASAEAAANKLVHARAIQNIARAAMELGGPGILLDEEGIELLWRQTMTESIGGGTTEVMTGIVAKNRLGLGGSRRAA
ncbi:acyl-CoA dehydrogenase family protein [Paraburkholderia pallida]|uniref:Pilus assembly protein CpaD n=1 Tax=Paraburkholderia pallida TaxID=2547399 RepID=A0A4P7CXQ0_9BURK|nr:acyl-CoA dehydrogenase family protein [Paraburkholderia pallida]QBQ99079.1 pilus assembly protein CpaD [Paraburkholderia pallida]